MASLAPTPPSWQLLLKPLQGWPLLACALIVWVAGAAYCMGYEQLLSGLGHWPGSLTWSAIAVLPWFALFEFAKQPRQRALTQRPGLLLLLVAGVATGSILLEYLVNMALGDLTDRLGLLLLRRVPAIAATLLLIALAQRAAARTEKAEPADLAGIAGAIDWLAAADNYVELHIGGRISLRRMTMAQATQALRRKGFVRIHRRYLVNRARIATVGDKFVRLTSGVELPIGSAFAANLASRPGSPLRHINGAPDHHAS